MTGAPVAFEVVVPTIGRPSLTALLQALAHAQGPLPEHVRLVDDRRAPTSPLIDPRDVPSRLAGRLLVLRGRAAGPAAARNVGWGGATAPWIAFLDDDVMPDSDWLARLVEDLRDLPADVGASQGRLRVPLTARRRATDWERNVAGLETAQWATADMAYRRDALASVGGFDERFGHAWREDADLALRARAAGWRLERGRRTVAHPVRPADFWISVRLQRGNADDVLMQALHGRRWRRRAGAPRGRRPFHLAIAAAGLVAIVAAATGRRRLAAMATVGWVAGIAEFAWARIAPGPRTSREVVTMLVTSAVLPHAAAWHWLRGWLTLRSRLTGAPCRVLAVLLDRDGTLVVDVPHNGDPTRVTPMPGARAALDRLRAAGVRLAVVSNQSGVARGLLSADDVRAVNARVEALLGPLGPWLVCVHGPDDACRCRKPAPGLVVRAARALGVRPRDCVLIGDTGADVDAARAAGARSVLVPTPITRREEVRAAPTVAADLEAAVDLLLSPTGRERLGRQAVR